MTTPVQHGHPDWARTVSAADILAFNFDDTQTDVIETRETVFVGNLPYLFLALDAAANGVRVQLNWRDAQSGGNLIGLDTVDTFAPLEAYGPIANQGPYVQIVTTVSATPTAFRLNIWQTLVPAYFPAGGSTLELITVDGQNVLAGVTRTDTAGAVRWGWGHWTSIFDNGVDSLSRLYAVDFSGFARLLDVMGAGISNDSRLIMMPKQPVRISSFNADAAARLLYATALIHPGPV